MISAMLHFLRRLHNRRPILLSVLAFIIVVVTATTMTIWWNLLLVQNHRVLMQMTAAAKDPTRANLPLALMMIIGLLLSLVIVLGLVYMFLRLIRSVQLNLAQSQFIAAVTHELKSPVAALQILLDTIRDPSTPIDKRKEFEQCMDSDLKRLRLLVDEVLDTARLENLSGESSIDDVRIKPVLDSCVDALETRLITTGSQLRMTSFDEGIMVRANKRLLVHALANILDNSVKYSGGPAEIEIIVDCGSPKSIGIEVCDKGLGIPRKELKKIFRRFYRSPDTVIQGKPGTGLGLYFARLAIRAQGGKLSVHSPGFGEGTTFRLELPRA